MADSNCHVQTDRRTVRRIPLRLESQYVVSGDSQVSKVGEAWTDDISEGGVGFQAGEGLTVGQPIQITIRGKSTTDDSLALTGTVAWQGGNTNGGNQRRTGVSFDISQGAVENRVRKWLQDNVLLEVQKPAGPIPVDIGSAYDGSTVTYRLLRAFGWGPLNNLGYFFFRAPLSALNLLTPVLAGIGRFLPGSQETLVKRSIKLLKIEPKERVLDVACGRGKGSFIMGSLHPRSVFTAIDLLPDNVQVAETLYGTDNLEFRVGDAMNLPFGDKSFSKLLCLEAAFHFPDRGQFLKEAARVLVGGGRAVIVDFMWNSQSDRSIHDNDQTQLVRDIWKWDDFSSIDEYLSAALAAGFEVEAKFNWSSNVTIPMELLFRFIAWCGQSVKRRTLLNLFNPLLQVMGDGDWVTFATSARAHSYVRKHTSYIALVLIKRP